MTATPKSSSVRRGLTASGSERCFLDVGEGRTLGLLRPIGGSTVRLSLGPRDAVPTDVIDLEIEDLRAILVAAGLVADDLPQRERDLLHLPVDVEAVRRGERHRLADLLEAHRTDVIDFAGERKHQLYDLIVFLLRLDQS